MSDDAPQFDQKLLQAMNEKAIQNQFFTPDKVYIDLALFKDFNIGVIYADQYLKQVTVESFDKIKNAILPLIKEYQKRTYDTVDAFFTELGYSDDIIEALLLDGKEHRHDATFLMAPATHFLNTLIRHTIRNQNNSRPAAKYVKNMIDKDQYTMDAIPVTYYINTYPLTLSPRILTKLGEELGESLGVNIHFLNKDPMLFDQTDWDKWMEHIECFYLNSLGRFTRSPFVIKKQGDLEFMGCYFFARKRFEKCVIPIMQGVDFDQQIQMVTSHLDMLCDFAWLQNNEVRLTEEPEDVPVDEVENPEGIVS